MRLTVLPHTYAVCRLAPTEALPAWALASGALFSLTRTDDELSLVCLQDMIPEGVQCEMPWKALKVLGPLDFALVGILSSLSTTLAQAGVSIFALSTYDTDYILVKTESLQQALLALQQAGHTIL